MTNSTRLLGVDALRGVLAIAVALHHIGQHIGIKVMESAWLAVDVFFILSGLVIGRTYEKKICNGMKFGMFLQIRLTRLYPMYFAGLLLGIIAYAGNNINESKFSLDVATRLLTSLLIIPFPLDLTKNLPGSTSVFIFNDPAWSLFFEIFVNIFFYVFLAKFNNYGKFLAISLTIILYLHSILDFKLSNGFSTGNFFGGFSRVSFYFFLGYFFYKNASLLKKLTNAWTLPIFFLIIILFNIKNYYILMFGMFIAFPLCTWYFMNIEITFDHKYAPYAKWLGDISFPLYITHFPILKILQLSSTFTNLPSPLQMLCSLAFSILLAHYLSMHEGQMRRQLDRFIEMTFSSIRLNIK